MKRQLKWFSIVSGLLVVILLPFAIYADALEQWTAAFIKHPHAPMMTAAVLASLLASDVFLPVPSSVISTAGGYLLGFSGGLMVSWIGMSAGCAFGFAAASTLGRPVVGRLVGQKEIEKLERMGARAGGWVLILARPIPVLAEASVIVAGMGGLSWRRFIALTSISNFGISVVYSAIGAHSLRAGSLLMAFAASVMLPALIMLLVRVWGGQPQVGQSDPS